MHDYNGKRNIVSEYHLPIPENGLLLNMNTRDLMLLGLKVIVLRDEIYFVTYKNSQILTHGYTMEISLFYLLDSINSPRVKIKILKLDSVLSINAEILRRFEIIPQESDEIWEIHEFTVISPVHLLTDEKYRFQTNMIKDFTSREEAVNYLLDNYPHYKDPMYYWSVSDDINK